MMEMVMTGQNSRSCTGFAGETRLASGALAEVVALAKAALERDPAASVLIFDDDDARQIEIDWRGSIDAVLARLAARPDAGAAPARGVGRPKLGVTAREVTLLPRHWDWLAAQPGGASVTLRKLVEEARRAGAGDELRRQAQESAYRFMTVMAGDRPGFEEATRALFAGDGIRFAGCTAAWPHDIRAHASKLGEAALAR
jgi:hypothetical protein